jgi:hypothetical protein
MPLTQLTQTDQVFIWSKNANSAFEGLKQAFTSKPILRHIDPAKRFVLEVDASDFALGSVLSQTKDDGRLHPVAFHSRKFEPAEINYENHDKELLAILDSFQQWRQFLEGSAEQIIVYNDHKNLTYLQSARVLNCRQARWAQYLSHFDFVITYRPDMQQGKADTLSRSSYMELRPGEVAFESRKKILLGFDHLRLMELHPIDTLSVSGLLYSIREQINVDEFAQDILDHIIPDRASCSLSSKPRQDYNLFTWHDALLF